MSEPTNTPKSDAVEKTAEVPKKKPNQLTAFWRVNTNLRGGYVKVIVGPSETEFFVHVALLKADSDNFRAALEGKWIEARTGEVHLSDVHPFFFASYVYWLYHQTVPFFTGEDVVLEDANIEDTELFIANALREVEKKYPDSDARDEEPYWKLWSSHYNYLRLIAAYILGDCPQSRRFKNTIMDQIIAQQRTVGGDIPQCLSLRHAFENTTPKSHLRKLLGHFTYWRGQVRFLRAQFNVLQNPEFMAQLGTMMLQWGMDIKQDGSLGARDLSKAYFHQENKATTCAHYHEHEEGEPRCTWSGSKAAVSEDLKRERT